MSKKNKAVRWEQDNNGVGIITLSRPDNRNSMTPELLEAFGEATHWAQKNNTLRALIITGEGSCFSAGADFKSDLQVNDADLLEHQRSFQLYGPFLSVLDIPVPVIAALNGHAVGGGFGLSLLCDIRIANADAKYGANFTKIGLSPGLGISYLLPRLIGLSNANEMLFTGRLLLGTEAKSFGLVSQACHANQVLLQAKAMAKEIASNAPVAVRLTKKALQEALQWDVRGGAYRESFAQAATLKMNDAQEGMQALLEKRTPQFSGK